MPSKASYDNYFVTRFRSKVMHICFLSFPLYCLQEKENVPVVLLLASFFKGKILIGLQIFGEREVLSLTALAPIKLRGVREKEVAVCRATCNIKHHGWFKRGHKTDQLRQGARRAHTHK